MSFSETPEKFKLNAVPDVPDVRDLMYQPALIPLTDQVIPPRDLVILDQGEEGACTGFGLAATINFLNQAKRKPIRVSPRMLYEMARKFDEWDGDDYSGSSCRGAMRGWQNMGVCDDTLWPYENGDNSELTAKQSTNARNNTPGAYYRLSPRVEDFHVALNEVGVLFVSAQVHEGWYTNKIKNGVIPFKTKGIGGHAFAIVGYNDKGFFVQNSWGEEWGDKGIALWSYQDWRENISDAWVVRLAVPVPQLWASRSFRSNGESATQQKDELGLFKSPKRHEIKGHFVHIDDGQFHTKGKYFSSLADVKETSDILSTSDKYKHLVLYAHGGLNSPVASAERIAAMKNTFKQNAIYPYHFMYDTGLLEELKDIIARKKPEKSIKAEGIWESITDRSDKIIENSTRLAGRAFWREMKNGATSPFKANGAGTETLKALVGELKSNVKIHLVGHSTGGILLAHLLKRLSDIRPTLRIASCSLLAPACTTEDFKRFYQPLLQTGAGTFGIDSMNLYNLTDELEKEDSVAVAYRKSLLYLVSNAFEEKRAEKILGMQKFSQDIDNQRLKVIYSFADKKLEERSCSSAHGGFDNDPATMNHVLMNILGVNALPDIHFTPKSLDY